MDKIKLKAYLKCLYELEASLYFQQQVYNAVFQEQKRALSSYKVEQEIPHQKAESQSADGVLTASMVIFIIIFAIIGFIWIANSPSSGVLSFFIDGIKFIAILIGASFVGCLVGCLVGIPIKKLVEKAKMQEEIQRVTLQNQQFDRRNAEIRARNADSKALARRKGAAIEVRLNEIQQGINETRKTLEQYYGLDIVFEKYRNFVAISSIYEYFVSGRCQELEGPYGAYNKFEEELRQNMIIARLDDVLRSLSRIERNQNMLYNAIMETNRELQQIRRGIDGISSNIQRIESNSEITAYNSRIAAENTEYMKNLQIYDILTRR